eukprot:1546593-Karenia_brevis.AAC.1
MDITLSLTCFTSCKAFTHRLFSNIATPLEFSAPPVAMKIWPPSVVHISRDSSLQVSLIVVTSQ